MAHQHWPGEYLYCPMCTAPLEPRRVGPSRRMACPSCDFVHFRNPSLGAALVVRDEKGRLLMVKRSETATRSGFWSMPAGYVDYGEEVRKAAARELEEETGLIAEIGEPVFVATNFYDPAKVSVCIWFATRVTGGDLVPGDDAVEAGFFDLDDLPPLAFDTDAALVERLRRET